ncbi:hypothetical protein BGZ60DRAFT_525097 [Tricladium varicosporioides]|nr:hypothetical protein BGZ60DRAFT_525097 [Hymenoscyphus varicosporioides]
MAALFTRGSSPENSKPFDRRRYGGHGGVPRRPRSGSPRSSTPLRSSPPYQLQWSPQQLPTPTMTPSSSTVSLSLPIEQNQGITMERTPSGNSILSDTPYEHQYDYTSCTDKTAADLVERHFRQVPHGRKRERTKHERILRRLIKLDDPLDDGTIDDEALLGILTTCDSIFFGGALAGRVSWEWSSQDRYQYELIGKTALRQCADRKGFETLIILSEPILKSSSYDRRLLLKTFLHELVHCYLFIQCGFEARGRKGEGGHTEGFHTIAKIIDNWIGDISCLSLCNMKANLDNFRKDQQQPVDPQWRMHRDDRNQHHSRCSYNQRPDPQYAGYVGTSYDYIYK